MLEHSLRQETSRDHLRPSLLARYNAIEKLVQELHLLLGLHWICRLPRQSPAFHVAQPCHRLRWTCRFLGKIKTLSRDFLLQPNFILVERTWKPLDPLAAEKLASTRHQRSKDSRSRCEPAYCSLQFRLLPQLHLRVLGMAFVLHHDSVSAGLSVRRRWNVSDDNVGSRQAPQLQEGVQGLPQETKVHYSIFNLSALGCKFCELLSGEIILYQFNLRKRLLGEK